MEAIVRHVQLLEEFESDIRFTFSQLQRVTGMLPRAVKGAHTEHVITIPAEGVPVTSRETQMLSHRFAEDHFFRVVMTECQRISAVSTFVANCVELVEICVH
ncbi:hypothetical protein SRABI106_04483 [Rahnella aquatilis]|nr:hypothetical protein SRABI106_04483 [Rahnella aquatilis]